MGRAPKTAMPESESPATEQFESLVAFNGAAMEAFSRTWQAYTSGMAALSGEIIGFTITRMETDAEMARTLVKCGNWADAAQLQQDWARNAAETYLAEAGKLVEIASHVASESWKPVEGVASTGAELHKARIS